MNTNAQEQHPSILVIENDAEGRSLLRTSLSAEHYCLREETTAVGALKQVAALQPDAVLLDPMLPDMDGLDVIRQVRSQRYSFPIIVLSMQADEQYKVVALDAGADDFLGKPFAVGELLARLRAALRRVSPLPADAEATVFRTGNMEVDFSRRVVRANGQEIHLTPIECNLMWFFAHHPNRILTHSHLIQEIWGSIETKHMHSLRVYIAHLRRKLDFGGAGPRLETEPNIGYRFQTE